MPLKDRGLCVCVNCVKKKTWFNIYQFRGDQRHLGVLSDCQRSIRHDRRRGAQRRIRVMIGGSYKEEAYTRIPSMPSMMRPTN